MSVLKRLIPFLKPYKFTIVATLSLGVLLSGVTIGTARLVQIIIDQVFVDKNQKFLLIAPFAIVGIYLVSGAIRFVHMFFLKLTSEKIGLDIRSKLQSQFAYMSLEFHAGNSSGALMSKTIHDVISVQQGLGLLADIVREPLSAIAMLCYLFYVDWKLTIITFISAPILIIASRSLGKSVRKYSHVQQFIMENVTLTLKETLDGIRVIKAFTLEKHMKDKFQNILNQMVAIRKKILMREEVSGPVFELLAAMTFGGILYYAGSQAIQGNNTVGAFMSYVFVLGSMQGPIKKLQDAHVRLQHAVASTTRIFEILDAPVTVKEPEEVGRIRKQWNPEWKTIEYRNVCFSYGNKEVLKGVNLTVNRGEVVAIVGGSGGGKTTLVNLLPRFYDVTSGQILVDGVDVRDFSTPDLRKNIGLVTQDVFLFNETIRENIIAGQSEYSLQKIREALTAANAENFVKNLHNKEEAIVGDRGSLLSGGERQRVSIARAVFKNTPILILDEATSSLDSESEKLVQQALEKLMNGRTTFVIAHRLSTIQNADRIIVLSEGKIIEQGKHADLLSKQGAYYSLHRHQFG